MKGWGELTKFLKYCHDNNWVTSYFRNSKGEFHFHIRPNGQNIIDDVMTHGMELDKVIEETEDKILKKLEARKKSIEIDELVEDLI